MATSLALRKATTASLLSKLLNPIRSASVSSPSVSRYFVTNTQLSDNIGGDDLGTVDVERRSSPGSSLSRRRDLSPGFFPDVVDPFSSTRTVSQLLNLMDQFMDTPLGSPRMGGTSRRGWDVKEDEKALYLSMDMPGLGKEDVKVCVDQNTLVIKGEGPKESEDDESGRRYSSRLDLPPNVYRIDDIKAEMKNGVLKVVVPRVKGEESSDMVEVKVE